MDYLLPTEAPFRIESLALGVVLLRVLTRMNASLINSRLEKLLLRLDSGDKAAVGHALIALSLVIPRLNLESCLRDAELRATLHGVPDRLMAALSENLEFASAAKHAAFALVAAMYPKHYGGEILAADEKTARADLETIFEKNNVSSFFTVNAKAATNSASIEAKLWNGVPFKLAGVKPSLVRSRLFDLKGDLKIFQVKGAKATAVIPTAKEKLLDGQYTGLTAVLKPDVASAVHGKVVVYFGKDDQVYSREVFDTDALFPSMVRPKPSEKAQKHLRR